MKHGGEWRYGLLVARWVEPSKGGRPKTSNNFEVMKKSAARFAKDACVSDMTVSKYLRAWNLAAEKGLVPSSSGIAPGEEIDLDLDELTQELWIGSLK